MIIFTAIVIVSCLGLLFLLKSFGIMPPDKFGVKIFLGKPSKTTVKSNWYFAPWPFVKVVKITKKIMTFEFMVETAITGRGKVAGYGETIIEPIEIDIKCTIYAQFDEDEAEYIVQYAPGYNAEALGPLLVPYASDTVRALVGRLPWRLINRERYKSATWVQARLIGDSYYGIEDNDETKNVISFKDTRPDYRNRPDFLKMQNIGGQPNVITDNELAEKSPFVILRLKNVSFVIEDVIFPEEIITSIIAPEKAQLDGQAKVITSEAEKTKKIKEGEGDADARGKMLAAIKQDKDLEALSALKEIGKGPSNFIFSLPETVQKVLAKIGGSEDKK